MIFGDLVGSAPQVSAFASTCFTRKFRLDLGKLTLAAKVSSITIRLERQNLCGL